MNKRMSTNRATAKNKKQRARAAARRATSQVSQVRGQGGYFTDLLKKAVPKGTFANWGSRGGQALGKAAGIPGLSTAGSYVGRDLGAGLSNILGFGDYTVMENSIAKQGTALAEGTEVPTFGNYGHETRVCHREYIGDIVTPAVPANFTNSVYVINAGNVSMFPWLAPLAANFQQYKFNGLVLQFKTLSSDITAGGALGSVILATNYDVIDNAFVTKIQMENSQYAVSAKPSLSQVHAVECAPHLTASNLYYVRSTTGSGSTDDRFYDLGKFQIATAGLPGTAGLVLGELWATYDVSLFKPELSSPIQTMHMNCTSGVTTAACFGSTQASAGTNLGTAAGNSFFFTNVGTYTWVSQVDGTVFANPTITGSAATTLVTRSNPLPGTLTTTNFVYTITVTSPGQNMTHDFSGSTTLTTHRINITRMPIANFTAT